MQDDPRHSNPNPTPPASAPAPVAAGDVDDDHLPRFEGFFCLAVMACTLIAPLLAVVVPAAGG